MRQQLSKSTLCMASGSTSLSTAPAEGKAKRGEKYKVSAANSKCLLICINWTTKTYLIKLSGNFNDDTHPLTISRTCEAMAPIERHVLHSVGEQELVDGTCGREREEGGKYTNEE